MDNKYKDLEIQNAQKDSQINKVRTSTKDLKTDKNKKKQGNIDDDVIIAENETIIGEEEVVIGEREINDMDDLFEDDFDDDDVEKGPIYY